MGGKKKTIKVIMPKVDNSLPTRFKCPACTRDGAVKCTIKRTMNLATLKCASCAATYVTKPYDIDHPIDIYTRWIDALEASDSEEDSDSMSEEAEEEAAAAAVGLSKERNKDLFDADSDSDSDDADAAVTSAPALAPAPAPKPKATAPKVDKTNKRSEPEKTKKAAARDDSDDDSDDSSEEQVVRKRAKPSSKNLFDDSDSDSD